MCSLPKTMRAIPARRRATKPTPSAICSASDISRLDGVLQGQDPREEVPAALTDMRDTFKEMNGRMARAMGLTRASRQKEQER